MEIQLKDNTGNQFGAKVDSDKRLHVNSVTRTQLEQACILGEAYNVATGVMTLTSGNESAVGVFSYNGDDPLVINELLVILGDSTGGAGSGLIKLVKNPKAGTIFDNAVPVSTVENRLFSSSKTVDADAYKGAEGDTITNGVNFAITSRDNFDEPVVFDAAPIVLKKGNSLGVTYTPPSGNTSQSIVVAGTIFVETATVSGDEQL